MSGSEYVWILSDMWNVLFKLDLVDHNDGSELRSNMTRFLIKGEPWR